MENSIIYIHRKFLFGVLGGILLTIVFILAFGRPAPAAALEQRRSTFFNNCLMYATSGGEVTASAAAIDACQKSTFAIVLAPSESK